MADAAGGQVSAQGTGNSYSFGGGWDLGILSGAINYGYGQAAESQAWKRQKKMWRKGPSYIVEGLRRAGINPILAFAKGAPGVGAAQMGPVGPGTDLAGGLQKGAQARLAGAQIEAVEAQADLARAQARTATASAIGQEFGNVGRGNEAIIQGWWNSVLTNAEEAVRDPRGTSKRMLDLLFPDEMMDEIRKNRDRERSEESDEVDRIFKEPGGALRRR